MKKYIIPIIFILPLSSWFVIRLIVGSYSPVEDGLLVTLSRLSSIGPWLFPLGLAIGLGISIWSLFHNPKKYDKWMFGIFSAILILYSTYFIIAVIFVRGLKYLN